ncbi:YcnI family protein [Gordonia sp. DT30]|uniref:YcnI family copper-binding membrane protein n=1 Tax=Gordonia sp. DT30 TaxID=3416546 RepID=UPI003CEA2418
MRRNKSHNRRHRLGRGALMLAAIVATLGFAQLALAPLPRADAHVTVDPGTQIAAGGYGVVRLLVPSESDTAKTTAVSVTIPDGVDFTSARTTPVPGWTATVDHRSGADGRVTRITWTATTPDNALTSTELGQFAFSAGPWPTNTNTVNLPTEQRYSDGSTVSWNEIAVDQGSEPEHPAPVVHLGAAGQDAHGQALDHAETGSENPDWTSRWIAIAGLVVAVLALVALAFVYRSGRNRPE